MLSKLFRQPLIQTRKPRSSERLLFLKLLFQHPFQHFACGVFRQFVFKVNLFGDFEIRQMSAQMGAHVGFIQRFAVFELDKGDDFFVGVLVFHTDDGCGFDGVEFVNRLFDFARINVLPFGNNQVFFCDRR